MSGSIEPYRPQYGYGYGQVAVATDQRTNAAHLAVAWVLTVLTLGYLLPWAIAATRGKSNAAAVAVVNIFAGWTLIGWIVALVMACGTHQVVRVVPVAVVPPAGWYPDPEGYGQRYWDGGRWTEHRAP